MTEAALRVFKASDTSAIIRRATTDFFSGADPLTSIIYRSIHIVCLSTQRLRFF